MRWFIKDKEGNETDVWQEPAKEVAPEPARPLLTPRATSRLQEIYHERYNEDRFVTAMTELIRQEAPRCEVRVTSDRPPDSRATEYTFRFRWPRGQARFSNIIVDDHVRNGGLETDQSTLRRLLDTYHEGFAVFLRECPEPQELRWGSAPLRRDPDDQIEFRYRAYQPVTVVSSTGLFLDQV